MEVLKIGRWEKAVLKYLALNPNQHQQAIQQALGIPGYGTVVNTMKSLHKKQFVEFKMAKNRRNKPIKLWRLSDRGITYVIMQDWFDEEEARQFLINYIENVKTKQIMKIFVEELGAKKTMQILGMSAFTLLSLQNNQGLNPFFMLGCGVLNKALNEEDTVKLRKAMDRIASLNGRTKQLWQTLKKFGLV